jgi:hypothetical protein
MDEMKESGTCIPPEAVAQARSHIAEAREALKDYIQPLSAKEKRRMLKVGDKNIGFVSMAHSYAAKHAEFVSPIVGTEAFKFSAENNAEVRALRVMVRSLDKELGDAEVRSNSSAYTLALDFYNTVKRAASKGHAQAMVIYNELRARFPSKGRGASIASDTGTQPVAETAEAIAA